MARVLESGSELGRNRGILLKHTHLPLRFSQFTCQIAALPSHSFSVSMSAGWRFEGYSRREHERDPLPNMFRLFLGVFLCALVLSGGARGVQGVPTKPRPATSRGPENAITDSPAGPHLAMKRRRFREAQRHLQLIQEARGPVWPIKSRRLQGLWHTLLQ